MKNPVLPRIIADHLGSVRVTLDQNGNIDSWTDYYPFGKEARGSSTSNRPKEQFTGKERDSEIGLDYFGARYYNPDIVRWTSVDPLWEKHPDWNPYNYVLGNPIILVDPDGRQVNANVAPYMATKGFLEGFGNGLKNTVVGLAQMAGPQGQIETLIGVGKAVYNYEETWSAISQGVSDKADKWQNGSTYEKAFVAGEIAEFGAELLVGSKGGGNLAKAGEAASLSERVVVIGQGMERVEKFAAQAGAEVFKPSAGALKEWNALVKAAGGKQLSDDAVKATKIFKENEAWIRGAKSEGATIIDLGRQKSKSESTFYRMEESVKYED